MKRDLGDRSLAGKIVSYWNYKSCRFKVSIIGFSENDD